MDALNILICGQVRDAELFAAALERFQASRADGTIDRVVYSTWGGEVDHYPGFRQLLDRQQVELVETRFPETYMESQGNYFYQATQIVNGLERFPSGAPILKTRGDVRANFALHYRECKAFWDEQERNNPVGGDILQRRIAVGGGAPYIPFWFEDRYFFGTCADLRQLVRISRSGDVLWNPKTAIAEIRFYATMFTEHFPVVRHIMRIFWMLRLLPHDPGVYNTDIVYRSMAIYHYVVKTFFTVGLPESCFDREAFSGTIQPPPAPLEAPDDPVTSAIKATEAYRTTAEDLDARGVEYLTDPRIISEFRNDVDRLGRDTVQIYGDFVLPASA